VPTCCFGRRRLTSDHPDNPGCATFRRKSSAVLPRSAVRLPVATSPGLFDLVLLVAQFPRRAVYRFLLSTHHLLVTHGISCRDSQAAESGMSIPWCPVERLEPLAFATSALYYEAAVTPDYGSGRSRAAQGNPIGGFSGVETGSPSLLCS
jgi:hypothetical protein